MKSWALDNIFVCICDLFCEHRPGKKMLQLAKQLASISVTFYMVDVLIRLSAPVATTKFRGKRGRGGVNSGVRYLERFSSSSFAKYVTL